MIPRNVQITVLLLLGVLLATGIYFLQLKRHVARTEGNADSRPLAAPVAGPKERVALLLAYDDDAVVRRREVTVALPPEPGPRAREIVRALLAEYLQKPSPHPVAEGSDVREAYMLEDGTCVVDLDQAFADGHRSGILEEQLSVVTLAASIAENVPAVKRVKFIVEGKDRETLAGHADLMAVYDVADVRQMARELE